MNDFKWPQDGFVVVLAEKGKMWAATVDPHFLKDMETKSSEEIFERYFRPAIFHVRQMASEARMQEITDSCKKQVNRKFAAHKLGVN